MLPPYVSWVSIERNKTFYSQVKFSHGLLHLTIAIYLFAMKNILYRESRHSFAFNKNNIVEKMTQKNASFPDFFFFKENSKKYFSNTHVWCVDVCFNRYILCVFKYHIVCRVDEKKKFKFCLSRNSYPTRVYQP